MKLKYILLLLAPIAVMASSAEAEAEHSTDIVARTINFLIFAGIIYYLIADKVKAYFRDRSKTIADNLVAVQDKLAESNSKKEEALKTAESSTDTAKDIVTTAKKEADLLVGKIKDNLKVEISNLEKSHTDRVEVEEKKMSREVVNEVIDEMFKGDGAGLKNEDLLDIIKKKVA
jgi:F-type H+-transporting ATPase subunit b